MLNNRNFYFRHQVNRFVLLFVGRTGSTYLISLLNSHPEIYAEGENLVDFKEGDEKEQLNWTREFLTPPIIGRHAALGFKTKLVDILDPAGFAQLLQEMQCNIIHLQRKNHVKAVISRVNALRLWEKTGEWNLFDEKKRLSPFTIEPDEFDALLKHREKVDQALMAYVTNLQLPTLSLYYEDMLLDQRAFLQKICSFVGVKYRALKGKTFKNTTDNLRDVILNFDELRSQYVGTPYEPMFDEILVP